MSKQLSDGTKRMMQKRREAARARSSEFDWAHWYNKDVGRLLKQLRELGGGGKGRTG